MNRIIMLKALLCWSFFCYAQRDSVFFIGEIRWKEAKNVNGVLSTRIPYENYTEILKYRINTLHSVHRKANFAFSVKEYKKETYYKGQEVSCVEVRIGMSAAAFYNDDASIRVKGDMDVGLLYSKKPIAEFTIVRPAKGTINYIDSNTFKLKDPIEISFPEEVSLNVITSYINGRLYSAAESAGGFQREIKELAFFKNEPVEGPLSYNQLMRFFRLLDFIEPFVSENSFLESEATQLNQNLLQSNRQLADSVFIAKLSKDSFQILEEGHRFSLTAYQNYLSFRAGLRGYYKQLKNILFLQTPVQYTGNYRQSLLGEFASKSNISFAVLPGLSHSFINRYNVSISPIDSTVQFQKASGFNTMISAGLFWSPPSKSSSYGSLKSSSPNNLLRDSVQTDFALGAFINYFISPGFKMIDSKSPLGVGLGIGFRKSKWGMMGLINYRRVRYPRKYFIDNFKDQNKQFLISGNTTSYLDLDDNTVFFSRADFSIGLSVLYIFRHKNSSWYKLNTSE